MCIPGDGSGTKGRAGYPQLSRIATFYDDRDHKAAVSALCRYLAAAQSQRGRIGLVKSLVG